MVSHVLRDNENCSGVQTLQELIYLHLSTDCFMKIPLNRRPRIQSVSLL